MSFAKAALSSQTSSSLQRKEDLSVVQPRVQAIIAIHSVFWNKERAAFLDDKQHLLYLDAKHTINLREDKHKVMSG